MCAILSIDKIHQGAVHTGGLAEIRVKCGVNSAISGSKFDPHRQIRVFTLARSAKDQEQLRQRGTPALPDIAHAEGGSMFRRLAATAAAIMAAHIEQPACLDILNSYPQPALSAAQQLLCSPG